jgi:hypothetical protein
MIIHIAKDKGGYMAYTKDVLGKDLKPGDTIKVWWNPGQDTITKLVEYNGPSEFFSNGKAKIATFALNKTGMTIDNNDWFDLVTIEDKPEVVEYKMTFPKPGGFPEFVKA